MKIILFCSIFFLLYSFKGKCQKPFQIISNDKYLTKVDTFNTTVKDIFNAYYVDCLHKHYFQEGVGVVEVVIYKDSLDRNIFALTAMLDDRYLDAPTDTYFSLGNELYLLYQGEFSGLKD